MLDFINKQHVAKQILKLKSPFKGPKGERLFALVQGTLERWFYLSQVNQIYDRGVQANKDRHDFLNSVLEVMDISYDISAASLAKIPRTGPVIVVSNHPFGGIEGIMLLAILRLVRPDVKILANYLLGVIPEMGEHCFYVDPFGGKHSFRANMKPMKESIRWVQAGHMLATFPSGEVSHIDIREMRIWDSRWSETIARIIHRTKPFVLPFFFKGRNDMFFQIMGLIHSRVRTAMLPRELANKQHARIKVKVGSVIPYRNLEEFEDDVSLMDYLRFRTYLLSIEKKEKRRRKLPFFAQSKSEFSPIAEPEDRQLIISEIEHLSGKQCLIDTDKFCVYLSGAEQIPHVLREIGRLRETTFRAAGEGTGNSLDLDSFDKYYQHLFLWDKKQKEIAGAYRLVKTEEVLVRYGVKGLYTSTLFRYRENLLAQIGPALELGRSFIRPEYQKNYYSLLLLWKGLGCVIMRDPQYKSLFGPVSINSNYHSLSRQLIVAFLKINHFDSNLTKIIKARNPVRFNPIRRWNPLAFSRAAADIDQLSDLIKEIETQQQALPVLLRQYLKLGGRLLGFNVDPDFSNVLDGLIWVDLTEADPRILSRFMGRENVQAFLQYHRHLPADSAPGSG